MRSNFGQHVQSRADASKQTRKVDGLGMFAKNRELLLRVHFDLTSATPSDRNLSEWRLRQPVLPRCCMFLSYAALSLVPDLNLP